MSIRINPTADPLSRWVLDSSSLSAVIVAQSDASRILRQELYRYCNGQVRGRAFLIAGHRGAGKTSMVADALGRIPAKTDSGRSLMRALPVFLHAPNLFEPLSVEDAETESPVKQCQDTSKAASTGDATAAQAVADKQASDQPIRPGKIGSRKGDSTKEQTKIVLIQIILGLQRAVVREFSQAYQKRMESRADLSVHAKEWQELAAQFQVELAENPRASRLREFWELADALESGVLFDKSWRTGQGGLELIALNGMCNAHQRISGELTARAEEKRKQSLKQEVTLGTTATLSDLVKPITSILGGSAVAGGALAGHQSPLLSVALGVLTALAASICFKGSTSTENKRERQVDKVFIPDFTLRTLDRILPTLLDRLGDAGLAPVLIVDEMDKVAILPDQIEGTVCHLKQLMTDRVFSCFLTDRGYLEYLRIKGRNEAYGKAYSYFSHALLIAFQPVDIDRYLGELLYVDDGTAAASGTSDPAGKSRTALEGESARDLEVLKWVLRHRSKMHALALAREISNLRTHNDEIGLLGGAVRTFDPYRIDATFQVAIELQLRDPQVLGWTLQRPEMVQTLYDALYYLSRSWLDGDREVHLDEAGRRGFMERLVERMNLRDVEESSGPSSAPERPKPPVLTEDDQTMLWGMLEGMVEALCEKTTLDVLKARWDSAVSRAGAQAIVAPGQTVYSAMLVGDSSLLILDSGSNGTAYRWRYWLSATVRDLTEPSPEELNRLQQVTEAHVQYITAVERNLWRVLRPVGDMGEPAGQAFQILADRTQILDTTPAWRQVSDAIANIDNLQQGRGNRARLPNDSRYIASFAAMLRASAAAVVEAIELAAFVNGLRTVTGPTRLLPALELVSTALLFANRDAGGVRANVESIWNELRQALPALQKESLGTKDGVDLATAPIEQVVNVASGIGSDHASRLPWNDWIGRAWVAVFDRLIVLHRSAQDQIVQATELLCASRGVGPTLMLPISLQRASLAAWSGALLLSLDSALCGKKGFEEIPPESAPPQWLAVFALQQLGAASLDLRFAETLSDLVSVPRPSNPDVAVPPGTDLRLFGKELGLWTNRGASTGAAVVVRRTRESLTLNWPASPRLGFALVLTAKQLESAAPLLKRLLAALPSLTLALEQPTEIDYTPVVLAAELAAPKVIRQLHLYRREWGAMLRPYIVDPKTVDDVLSPPMAVAS